MKYFDFGNPNKNDREVITSNVEKIINAMPQRYESIKAQEASNERHSHLIKKDSFMHKIPKLKDGHEKA